MYKRWLAAALTLLLLLGAACSAEVENIADKCRYKVSEGNASEITDSSMGSAWKPRGSNPELRIMLPDSGAAYIQINWSIPPTNYTLTEYAADQSVIATHTAADDDFACISQLYGLNANTKYVFLSFSQSGQGINKIRVYPEGELPKTVVQWEKPHDKCDLLVVSTHEDDEWLWFGAIIPYYDLVMDKDVQVVYMANCGRLRYAEALNSIAVSGVKTYPMFVGLPDKRDSSLTEAINTWKSKDFILEVMTSIIRRFKPEVILTHDWNGEYGHPQHKLTSRCMEYAIEAAADPNQYPESAQEYGAWQVKKLYRHLETKGKIAFDWHVAYPEFGGRTGIQVATDSMNEHASQLKFYQVEDHGKYDNSLFGLSYSVVGDDVEHKDLFENIDASAAEPAEPVVEADVEAAGEPEAEVAPAEAEEGEVVGEAEAEGTEEPEEAEETEETEEVAGAEEGAEATPEPTDRPTRAPMPTPEPKPVKEKGVPMALKMVTVAAVIAVAGSGYLVYSNYKARKRKHRKHHGTHTHAKSGSGQEKKAAPKRGSKKGDS